MRALFVLAVGVWLAACGGDDDDPYRFEVSDEEWRTLCPNDPWDGESSLPQFFRSDGSPACAAGLTWESDFCFRYYGGNLDRYAVRPEWQSCEQPIVCFVSRDDPDFGKVWGDEVVCTSSSDAKRRSL